MAEDKQPPRPDAVESSLTPSAEAQAATDAAKVEYVRLEPGDRLFRQGDDPDRMYFIEGGEMLVTRNDTGREVTIAVLGPGDVVGEIGLLHEVKRTATVMAAAPVTLMAVSADGFDKILAKKEMTEAELGRLAVRRHAAALLSAFDPTGFDPPLERAKYTPGQVIVRQGDPADAFYILVEGSVEVWLEQSVGGTRQLALLRAPSCFGEVGLLADSPRTATIEAGVDGAEVFVLGKGAFAQLLGDETSATDIGAVAAARLVALMHKSSDPGF